MTETATKPKAKPGAAKPTPDDGLTQSERFIKAAQELETDDDPERFAERVRRLAQADSVTSGAHQVQGHPDGKK